MKLYVFHSQDGFLLINCNKYSIGQSNKSPKTQNRRNRAVDSADRQLIMRRSSSTERQEEYVDSARAQMWGEGLKNNHNNNSKMKKSQGVGGSSGRKRGEGRMSRPRRRKRPTQPKSTVSTSKSAILCFKQTLIIVTIIKRLIGGFYISLQHCKEATP